MKILLSLKLLLLIGALQAQTLDVKRDTIKWNCVNLKDLKTNSSNVHQCEFISFGDKKIKWVQSNGDFVTEWTITGVTGDWPDTQKNGTIAFAIASAQQGVALTGQIFFTRSDQEFYADLKVSGGPNDLNLRYQISGNEKN